MTKIAFIEKKFRAATLETIAAADKIIREYSAAGYTLTLRQLYYQFVARGWLPNKQTEYDRLGSIINDARLAGLISWEALEDRTRYVRTNPHWSNAKAILRASKNGFAIDKWHNQPVRPEVWIEKDALVGVIEPVCEDMDVPYFSCRGYVSASAVWNAHKRFAERAKRGQKTVILHLGDHDPSGIDMTHDMWKRLAIFDGWNPKWVPTAYGQSAFETTVFDAADDSPVIRRLALNHDQVEQFNPPPNPAKWSDSRADSYVAAYGTTSWELDALTPETIGDILFKEIADLRDDELWSMAEDQEAGELNELDWAVRVEEMLNHLRDVVGQEGDDLDAEAGARAQEFLTTLNGVWTEDE